MKEEKNKEKKGGEKKGEKQTREKLTQLKKKEKLAGTDQHFFIHLLDFTLDDQVENPRGKKGKRFAILKHPEAVK